VQAFDTPHFDANWLLREGQGVLRGPKSKEAARTGAIAGMSSALSLTQVRRTPNCRGDSAVLVEIQDSREAARTGAIASMASALSLTQVWKSFLARVCS